jgi:glucokinase
VRTEPAYVVAVDLGGTRIKVAKVTQDGHVLEMRYERTPDAKESPDALERLRALIRSETAEGRPYAVGVAVPGCVEETSGLVHAASNLGWRDLELSKLLSTEASCPVVLSHDVRAGGLAEGRAGAGLGAGCFVFLAIGTGLAAAIVHRGEPWPGMHAKAGEVGHLVVRPGGEPCACGRRGCIEAIGSAAAIARRYYAASGERLTTPEVIERAEGGDRTARRVWKEAIQVLAEAVLVMQVSVDPELIVIGGGLSLAGEALLAPLRKACELRGAPSTLRIVPASLGDTAGWRGAAMLGWDHVNKSRW